MFSFCKMQGTGNDFIIVNCLEDEFEYDVPILSQYLCDRHYGIGADGVIFIYKSNGADFKMKIFNQDGTEAEMCGNGIRCFAKYIFERNLIYKKEFFIETLAGIKKVKLDVENKKVIYVTVNMGKPEIENIQYIIEIDGEQYCIFPVSIGNPHAVCFVKNLNEIDIKRIGPILENYKYFPNKTNVEFVQILDKNNIKIRVWERGVGETNSCGTGACASTIVAINKKYVENNIRVKLKGGTLEVEFNKNENCIYLKGDAEEVFTGKIDMM